MWPNPPRRTIPPTGGIIHLQEQPGKTVGRRHSSPEDCDRLVDAAESLMPRLPFPRGVYRFHTHEEAHAWTENHILIAARNKARAHRVEPT